MGTETTRRGIICSTLVGTAALMARPALGQLSSNPVIDITLLDPKTGAILDESGKYLVRVNDKTIQDTAFYGGRIRFHNNVNVPIELHIVTHTRHVATIQRLAPRRTTEMSIVLWPPRGPETFDRIFDQLQIYERLYSQYAQSPNQTERNIWDSIWTPCANLLLEMRRPELTNATPQQIDFAKFKLDDVRQMYQISKNVIVHKPTSHCSCGRQHCCWCGQLKA